MASPSSKPITLGEALEALAKVEAQGHPVVFETPEGKLYTISRLVTLEIGLGKGELEQVTTHVHLVRKDRAR